MAHPIGRAQVSAGDPIRPPTVKTLPVLTAYTGTNADLFPHILSMFLPEGSVIADVTYGRGVLWPNVDVSKFTLLKSDLQDGIDRRKLPYENASIDALVIDLPYMHTGKSVHKALNKQYHNENNTSHESAIRLYVGGILVAARVLRQKGVIIVKCQDEIESGKQRLSHVELIQLLQLLGFEVLDQFVLMQKTVPMMRFKHQKHARKNQSYAIVARFRH